MYKCKYCRKEFDYTNPRSIGGHTVTCAKNPNRDEFYKRVSKTLTRKRKYELCCKECNKTYHLIMTPEMYKKGKHKQFCSLSCSAKFSAKSKKEFLECPWCSKVYNGMGIMTHIWCNHTEDGKKFVRVSSRGMKGKTAWNKNLTKGTDDRVRRYGEKVSKALKGRVGNIHSTSAREKIRKYMLEKYANGYVYTGCFTKKYTHNSPIAGKVSLDGTWELRVAIFFDGSELNWRRNTKGFTYINPKTNEKSTYIPDFFVYDWDTYIEVKGYISDVDRAKWKQFPEPLEIWDEGKLVESGILPQ